MVCNQAFNTSRTRQNGRYFSDDISKTISLCGNCCIVVEVSLGLFPWVKLIIKAAHNDSVSLYLACFTDACMRQSVCNTHLLSGQGATPVRGAPGWRALNLVGGMREPPSGSMQVQKLQFQSVIYGNPEHSNWHQRFPTHIWLFLAQCGILAGFIKTMQAE